jgi:SAM-dependent methyltransferase
MSDISCASSELDILTSQLSEFELGRYVLANGALDGYWTRYCIIEHLKNRNRKDIHPLESFLLNEAPSLLATQERFSIFQTQLQKRLRDNMNIASIPCGYMDDLLGLDFSRVSNVSLVGCDIDAKSCAGTKENALQHGLEKSTQTYTMDAWDVGAKFPEQFDMITSNGLNIYVSDTQKEIDLYRNFASALKSGGYLITSFLTPPPILTPDSPWHNVNLPALQKQKIIFSDILGVKWQNYNLQAQMEEKLTTAGFHNFEIHYDRQRIFPTVVAEKL